MKNTILLVFVTCLIYLSGFSQTTNYHQYVNPFIGTGGTGHTFPGAVLPFGMVQLSPDTRIDGSWDGCSGYHYSDSVIYGFTHTHLSGTGASDYGDILIMPTTGNPSFKNSEYASKFSHSKEKATPGFYQVYLNDDHIKAELTTTTRVGIHRYTFPKTTKANIILDLTHRDKTLKCNLKVIDSVTVIGLRISEGWAKEQHVYFAMKFNKPFKTKGEATFKANSVQKNNKTAEQTGHAYFQFDASEDNQLLVKVAISQTNYQGALKNLEEEAQHWNFDTYKKEAENIWEKQLSKIEVTTSDKDKLTTFYTALYHCMIHPSIASDVSGSYRGRDNKIHKATDFVPHTVFSLWDTYRALHPLFTIIEQKRTYDFIHTFLRHYKESKRLPMWELSANETDCMIGFHSVSVIADAFAKKTCDFDTATMYNALVAAANYTNFSIPTFNQNNYLQVDDESESVSKTLEYAYDNWCIAQVSKTLDRLSDYDVFMKRAQSYKNLFDKHTGFMRPRKNGNWLSPFEPREVNVHFTEANSWQYSFYVPQDITGLINLMGGEKNMEQKLDELFTTTNKTLGNTQVDITGLIGQYAHGNEPSQHIAYLYNYIGKSYKTQEKIHQILTHFYKNTPDGLIGNDDCGQMSAWYILSSMGFYQVCPGQTEYAIGPPLFDDVKIHLENGKTFEIKKQNPTPDFQYIQSVILNGVAYNKTYLNHTDIINGGKLEFIMQNTLDTSNYTFGKLDTQRPHSIIPVNSMIPSPIINTPSKIFDKTANVTLEPINSNSRMYYTLDGSDPTTKSIEYKESFQCDSSSIIKARAYSTNDSSSITVSRIYKRPNDWKIKLNSTYNKQYTGGGDNGIIDGLHGTTQWRSGEWQGYQYQDFECVIDLGKRTSVQSISSSYLQDSRSWILFPTRVEYFTSTDGKIFTPFGKIENGIAPQDMAVQIRSFSSTNPIALKVRYIKVKAANYGKFPDWHPGKGDSAFIFIDEIDIH